MNHSNFVDVRPGTEPVDGLPHDLFTYLTNEGLAKSMKACELVDVQTREGNIYVSKHCVLKQALEDTYPDHKFVVAQDMVYSKRKDAGPNEPAAKRRLSGMGKRLANVFDTKGFSYCLLQVGKRIRAAGVQSPSQQRETRHQYYMDLKNGVRRITRQYRPRRPKTEREAMLRNLSGIRVAELLDA